MYQEDGLLVWWADVGCGRDLKPRGKAAGDAWLSIGLRSDLEFFLEMVLLVMGHQCLHRSVVHVVPMKENDTYA